MNILLIEQECFKRNENKPLHIGAHSLHIAEYITKSQENNDPSQIKGKVFVLAKRDSLYQKVARSLGLHVILLPENGFINLKFYFLLRRHKINLVHTFDIESAKLLHSLRLVARKLPHAHSENRYLEEKDIFFGPAFKNTQGYLFADIVYKDHYGVCFGYNNSTVIPITLAPEVLSIPKNKVKKENQEVEDIEEITENIKDKQEHLPLFPVTKQDKSSNTENNTLRKVRFLIPCPLTTDGKYPEIIETLKAFHTIKGKEYNWEALFLGLGDKMQEMIKLADEAKILNHLLIFTGIENKDFFDSGDVCIFPVSSNEHLITPLLAAWKHKVPTIINETIAYCDLAKNERSVLIEDMKNPSAFALALDKMLKDTELKEKLVKHGENSLKEISSQKIDYFSFYKKIIQNKSS